MDKKLIVCYIGQDVEQFIGMSLDSIKDVADHIVFIDGGSQDDTISIIKQNKDLQEYQLELKEGVEYIKNKNAKYKLLHRRYEHKHKGANGRARQAYLKFIQEHFEGHWCLVLDPDEVVAYPERIKEIIGEVEKECKDTQLILNPHMRHLIGDLAHEDSTFKTHFCPGRLFKIDKGLYYSEVEHPVLQHKGAHTRINIGGFTIWHLAYTSYAFDILKRYKNHLAKSNIHTKEELRNWYLAHIRGRYLKKEFDVRELPKQIRKNFLIDDDDEFYFETRNIELKHGRMVKQWYDYFKPVSVLDLGCGKGPYLYFWKWFLEDIYGIELSEYAVKNTFIKDKIKLGNIIDDKNYTNLNYDLITAIDILEHLGEEDLDKTLIIMAKRGKKFLFSIPFLGDPNLERDSTHKIKQPREWWIKKIESHGIKIKDTPRHFLYGHQILVGEKE